MTSPSDRNFNGLTTRFKNNIYGTPKGMLRLYALREDFAKFKIGDKELLSILDAGGGMGQFSSELAEKGHKIELCDISSEMLDGARSLFIEQGLESQGHFTQCGIQDIPQRYDQQFDLVMNHAVLEWLVDPTEALNILYRQTKPGGWLSVMFYNVHGRTWRGLMNGKLHAPATSSERMAKEGIAPQQPLEPQWVYDQLVDLGLEVKSWRGIRFVYDHMHQKIRDRVGLEAIAASESEFGYQAPYKDLARYVHMLCYKPET
ncbi:SAM-dependent methyltransferase [Oleispira antarctica RB-8]|uniref:tRNA 5-carboxymethoxyuridine methyltransferase n=1 Tax=Oleispira antarctica RB-8 TaxID=698738 RepID=R4YL83_OLEAN|nr:SAM-dependent methyltransferase [Oleispira antarctica RB-8]|tara:strand:+ start:256 stop:1035 length:780 start_codon:yes stop_codon:yes gene_type:complete